MRPIFAPLSAPIIWMLVGIPLCVWAGVGWDALQGPRGTQMFLGAANNFYLLWLSPLVLLATPRTLLRAVLARSPMAPFALGALFVLTWMGVGIWLNGHFATLKTAVVPIVALANTALAILAWMSARKVRQEGHGPALAALLMGCLLVAGLGALVGAAVHLTGPLPTRQPFLYVDGFGNVRTLGETLMLALAAAIVWLWRRPHLLPLLLVVALSAGLAWTGTRAGWVGLGGATLLGIVWWAPGWRAVATTLAALIVGGLLATTIPSPDHNYGVGRITELARETGVAMEARSATTTPDSARLQLWTWGLDTIAQKPILGHGYGSMGALERPDYARFKHLHNLPLDLAFGTGVVVAGVLTLLLLWATLSAFATARRDTLYLLPLCAGGVLATSLFSGVFLFPITVVVAAIGLSGAGGAHLPLPIPTEHTE